MSKVILWPPWTKSVPWLDFPNVQIPDPVCRDRLVTVRIEASTIHKFYMSHRHVPIWQAWAHLVGRVPPVANASFVLADHQHVDFGNIQRPVACFRGVRRPWLDEDDGDSVLAYVLTPTHTLTFKPSLVTPVGVLPDLNGVVLVILVKPDDPLQRDKTGIFGVITKWEFVPSDSAMPFLPEEYGERYAAELWRDNDGNADQS